MPDKTEIPGLTGLRGLAACWVVIYHMHEFDHLSGPFAVLLRHGYLAVDVFFVLSGFVMALSYRGLFAGGFSAAKYGVFLLRRAARIYPLYAALTMAIAGTELHFVLRHHQAAAFAGTILQNLSLTEFWGFGDPIDGPAWSISTELAAYLAFPALAALTIYGGWRRAALVAAGCMAGIGLIAQIPAHASYPFPRQGPLDIAWAHTVWPLIRCVLEFTLGLAAFRFGQVPAIRSLCARPGWALAVAAPALPLLLTPGTDMVFVALIPALLLALLDGKNLLRHMLAAPAVLALGRLSYAIYLLHFPLMRIRKLAGGAWGAALGPGPADIAGCALFYLALLALAELCYRLIEAPGRRLVRRLELRLFPYDGQARAAVAG
jgi:peptidoglycan/LPS O-acetylase OafA/YrhL